jgi:hypothetical protein
VPEIPYTCDCCGRTEYRTLVHLKAGTNDDSARIAGWRIGATQAQPRNVICPECAGLDVGYWDRQTLTVARMAGVDAGRVNPP